MGDPKFSRYRKIPSRKTVVCPLLFGCSWALDYKQLDGLENNQRTSASPVRVPSMGCNALWTTCSRPPDCFFLSRAAAAQGCRHGYPQSNQIERQR